MIDTVKLYFYITKLMLGRLNDQKALNANNTKVYGNRFYLKNPFGQKNPTVWINHQNQTLCIEASLPKLVQGHNVFGSNRLEFLCLNVIKLIYNQLGLSLCSRERSIIRKHRIKIGRLDITCSFRLNSPEEVRGAIEEIFHQLRAKGLDWAAYGCDDYLTIYNQKGSKRISDKFYAKYNELLRNKIPEKVVERSRILKFALSLLRYELTYRAPELRRLNLEYADQWKPDMVRQLIMKRISMLNLQGSIKEHMTVKVLECPNKCSQTFYHLWAQGCNLRPHRHYAPLRRARAMLRHQGVDIFRPLGARNEIAIAELLTENNAYFLGPKALSSRGAIFGCKSSI